MQKYAFLSVYNKTGIAQFAQDLAGLGFSLIASGGTARHLREHGIEVLDIADSIGGGEILHHKVVTLDRKFHAMLLADDSPEEAAELVALGVPRIDLLCCDLYPLKEEIKKPDSTAESVIAKTDIGGPAMLRAAAKGGRIVICDAEDRPGVIQWLRAGMPEYSDVIRKLRAKAEFVVAEYGLSSAAYHGPYRGLVGEEFARCLYGENRWQTNAVLYTFPSADPFAPSTFSVKEGSERSYINFTDMDRLLQSATHIAAGFKKNFHEIPKIAIGAKHGNLCGAAVGPSAQPGENAIKGMLSGDPQAISGGWILVNFPLTEQDAQLLKTYGTEHPRILDGVIAPSISDDAIDVLARKTGKCRIVVNPNLGTDALARLDEHMRFRYVRGGFLIQSNYTFVPELRHRDMLLAWAVGSTSNSNTITLVKDGTMIANATGQQSRVLACRLALMIAQSSGHDVAGSSAYSDSFFPFLDGPKLLVDNGIKALFVTSGSIRDKEVFAYLKGSGVEIFTLPDEQARGFYSH